MPFASISRILDERANLMRRMLETLGIRQKARAEMGGAEDLQIVEQTCTLCQSTGICQSWLDEQEIIGRTSDPAFCPNYSRFLEWRETEKAKT